MDTTKQEEFNLNDSNFWVFEPREFEILFENEDFLIVDKPVGIASHPAKSFKGESVYELVESKLSRDLSKDKFEGIVSRLDVTTSGKMLVAKTQESFLTFKQMYKDRVVQKTYTALVQGYPKVKKGIINAPIKRKEGRDIRFEVNFHGREAITKYEFINAYQGFSLIKVYPKTGRTHQIRVHFQSINHPLLGDKMYGADLVLSNQVSNKLHIENRVMLDSTSLCFEYKGEVFEF